MASIPYQTPIWWLKTLMDHLITINSKTTPTHRVMVPWTKMLKMSMLCSPLQNSSRHSCLVMEPKMIISKSLDRLRKAWSRCVSESLKRERRRMKLPHSGERSRGLTSGVFLSDLIAWASWKTRAHHITTGSLIIDWTNINQVIIQFMTKTLIILTSSHSSIPKTCKHRNLMSQVACSRWTKCLISIDKWVTTMSSFQPDKCHYLVTYLTIAPRKLVKSKLRNQRRWPRVWHTKVKNCHMTWGATAFSGCKACLNQ